VELPIPTPPPTEPPAGDPRRAAIFLLATEVVVQTSHALDIAVQSKLVSLFMELRNAQMAGVLAVVSLAAVGVRTVARAWALGPGLRHAQGPGLAVAVAVAVGASAVGWVLGVVLQFGRNGSSMVLTEIRLLSSVVEWAVLAGLLAYGLLGTGFRLRGRAGR
jgi:hypothetical protein